MEKGEQHIEAEGIILQERGSLLMFSLREGGRARLAKLRDLIALHHSAILKIRDSLEHETRKQT